MYLLYNSACCAIYSVEPASTIHLSKNVHHPEACVTAGFFLVFLAQAGSLPANGRHTDQDIIRYTLV
jgi:hypothetical protein